MYRRAFTTTIFSAMLLYLYIQTSESLTARQYEVYQNRRATEGMLEEGSWKFMTSKAVSFKECSVSKI